MFRKHETLGTWVSEIFQLITIVTNLKRHSCLLLLPSCMKANGLFYFVSFAQDCKCLENTMSWVSSCTHSLAARQHGDREAGPRSEGYGVWPTSSSPGHQVCCLLMAHRWVPLEESSSIGRRLTQGYTLYWGQSTLMSGWYRDTKVWPLCLNLRHLWRAVPHSELLWGWLAFLMQTTSQLNVILCPVLLSSLPYGYCS